MDCGEVRENGAKYPNQRVVNIKFNAGIKPGERSRFCPVQLNLYWAAYQDLANYPKAFALWFYIASIQEDVKWSLSSTHICSITGMSESSYKRAFHILENKGYFKPSSAKDLYDFDASAFGRLKTIKGFEFDQCDKWAQIPKIGTYAPSLTIKNLHLQSIKNLYLKNRRYSQGR